MQTPAESSGRPTTPMSDDELAAVIATEQLGLEAYVRRLVRDPDDVADICQDAFVRLLLAARAGDAPDNPGAWLRRVAHNAVISAARHRAVVEGTAHRLVSVGEAASVEDTALRNETNARIADALRGVRADDRTAMILAAQGFEGGEIGIALGRTALAARVLLSRARGRLRAQLESAEAI